MLILRLPYALLIRFIVGVTSLIPIFGVIYKLLKENTNNKLISKELSNKDILNK